MPASTPCATQLMSMTTARASGATASLAATKLEKPKQDQARTKGHGDSRKRPK